METGKIVLDKTPPSTDDMAALEERERLAYEKQPQSLEEVIMWERVAAWPDEDEGADPIC